MMFGLVLYLISGLFICSSRVDGMAWNSDGSKIAFTSVADYIGVGAVGDNVLDGLGVMWNIRTVRPATIHIFGYISLGNRLTPGAVLHWMQWSPDGKGLLLEELYHIRLYSVSTGNNYQCDNRYDTGAGLMNAWSPDNRLLSLDTHSFAATVTDHPGPPDSTGSLAPKHEVRLNIEDRKFFLPRLVRWSPDTRKMLFITDTRDNDFVQIWCYDFAARRDMGTLFDYYLKSANRPRDYVWSPDGKSVALLFLPPPPAAPGVRIELWDVETCTKYQTLTLSSPVGEGPILAPPASAPSSTKWDIFSHKICLDSVHHMAWSRDGKRIGGAFLLQPAASISKSDAKPDFNVSNIPGKSAPETNSCEMCWWNVEDGRVLARKHISSPGSIDLVRLSPDLDKAAVSHFFRLNFLGRFSAIHFVWAPAEAVKGALPASAL